MLYAAGDLDSQIVACQAQAVAAGISNPRTYDAVGVLYCGIDTAVPGTYLVTYVVTAAGQTVSAQRTVIVDQDCQAGTRLCDDGSCTNGEYHAYSAPTQQSYVSDYWRGVLLTTSTELSLLCNLQGNPPRHTARARGPLRRSTNMMVPKDVDTM